MIVGLELMKDYHEGIIKKHSQLTRSRCYNRIECRQCHTSVTGLNSAGDRPSGVQLLESNNIELPPIEAESAQAEPAQAESAQAEPTQAEPAQAEPSQAEPAQAEPAQAGYAGTTSGGSFAEGEQAQ